MLLTTNNYKNFVILCSLQITTAIFKSFQSAVSSCTWSTYYYYCARWLWYGSCSGSFCSFSVDCTQNTIPGSSSAVMHMFIYMETSLRRHCLAVDASVTLFWLQTSCCNDFWCPFSDLFFCIVYNKMPHMNSNITLPALSQAFDMTDSAPCILVLWSHEVINAVVPLYLHFGLSAPLPEYHLLTKLSHKFFNEIPNGPTPPLTVWSYQAFYSVGSKIIMNTICLFQLNFLMYKWCILTRQ